MPHDWAGLGATPPVVAVVLREGARLVRERGWVQGRFRGDAGEVDAVQAVADACGIDLAVACKRGQRIDVGPTTVLGAALDRVCLSLGCRYLSQWNDDGDRTAAETAAALEAAAG